MGGWMHGGRAPYAVRVVHGKSFRPTTAIMIYGMIYLV